MKKSLSLLLLSLCGFGAWASVSDPEEFPIDKEAIVKVYHYESGDPEHHVIFKYADILNQAKREYDWQQTQSNPLNYKIEVRFAIYNINFDVYAGIDPLHSTYGLVGDYDLDPSTVEPDASEKIAYSIKKLADLDDAKVDIKFVYHNQPDLNDTEDIKTYIGSSTKKIQWGLESSQQMHNKFLIVRYLKNGVAYDHRVYTATSNIDAFTGTVVDNGYAQTGVYVLYHPGLYDAYSNYFDIIWARTGDGDNGTLASFQSKVRQEHIARKLNYKDKHFEAYFFPIPTSAQIPLAQQYPQDNLDIGWSDEFNPYTQLTNIMIERDEGTRDLRLTAYTCGNEAPPWNAFTSMFKTEILKVYHSTTHPRTIKTATEEICGFSGYNQMKTNANTHEKNMVVGFSKEKEWYSLTGSANFKENEFDSKANNMLLIRETNPLHPIYSEFVSNFESLF